MDTTHTFTVAEPDAAARLDVYLAGKLPGLTRSGVKNLLEKGRVLVDGRPAKAGRKVRPGETISVEVPQKAPTAAAAEAIPLDILYEDDDIIVINKPAGIAVHPGAGRPTGTLVNALVAHTGGRLSALGGPERPGIVHRLDKDTSGALVIAKNDASHASLARQFKEHSTGRKYIAIVWGVVKNDEGTIDMGIGRDAKHRKKISTRAKKTRAAVTNYKVLRRYQAITLLELAPRTGRTHQLRVHLAAINHPVVGDQVYGRKKIPDTMPGRVSMMLKKTKRQCLHAMTLKITHPAQKRELSFSAPLPLDMDELIKALET